MRGTLRKLGDLPFGGLGLTAIAVIGVALYLFPIYWMFTSGLKTSAEIFANPPTLVPRNPTLAILPVRLRAREHRALPAQQPDHRDPGDGA